MHLLFYLVTFMDFCEHMRILNLMSATCFKRVGAGIPQVTGHSIMIMYGHLRKAQSFKGTDGARFTTSFLFTFYRAS